MMNTAQPFFSMDKGSHSTGILTPSSIEVGKIMDYVLYK